MDEVHGPLAEALAACGVASGPGGYDASSLRAAAEARGLIAGVEAIPGRRHDGRARACYRALVWRPQARQWGTTPPLPTAVVHQTARGRGRTEAEALAKALTSWLRRWDIGPSPADRGSPR